ncbi:hypothetical protein NEOLI_002638 [Neolecta irregularis DAH-3]|uniref:UspA domain-containing protein n=1 Tax=Neolecta irregularis (strain DAH-3) TaxID=1198029 RepID=A0A1U7LRJ3_NEOID|nr:hypothetical protein NEOLI_002638 [Neolecta irregularis DAH-3]|eukprot:OLL25277.1 hypothetical protein NEOLI_002638 [Neolecta irregularis DAH-3]
MVFDAAKPRKSRQQAMSMESALEEERLEILRMLQESKNLSSSPLLSTRPVISPTEQRKLEFSPGGSGMPRNASSTFQNHRMGSASQLTPAVSSRRGSSPGPQRSDIDVSDIMDLDRAFQELSKRSPTITSSSRRAPDGSLPKDADPESAIDDSSTSGEESDDEEKETKTTGAIPASPKGLWHPPPQRAMSLTAAIEAERLEVLNQLGVNSASNWQPQTASVPRVTISDHAFHKSKRAIRPNTAFDNSRSNTPFSSDAEADLDDLKKAQRMEMDVRPMISNPETNRVAITVSRGDFQAASNVAKRTRSYVVCTDMSSEAVYAMEWAIGTVIRDGDIIYAVCALEETEITVFNAEEQRKEFAEDILALCRKLLKRTRLQVQVVIEVIHHKSPKHLLTEIIDHRDPTLVILGSRGRSHLKGVLLGSFSNYLVQKSSVPVMVARKKLCKTSKKRGLPTRPRLKNNLLATAKID